MGVIAVRHAAAELAGYRDLWRAAPRTLAERHGIAHRDVAGGVGLGCASVPGQPPAPATATDLSVEDAGEARTSTFGTIVAAAFGLPPDGRTSG